MPDVRSITANTNVIQNAICSATMKPVPRPDTMACPGVVARQQLGDQDHHADDRRHDRQERGHEAAPHGIERRADEDLRPVRVAGRQRARVAELGQGGALGGSPVDGAVARLRFGGVGDEGADLALEVGALTFRDRTDHGPDVSVGEGAHAGSPWSRPRIDASSRFQSSSSSAARRSPAGLVR